MLCDRRERLAARLYVALRVDCSCCTFYRGVVLGIALGITIASLSFLSVSAFVGAAIPTF